MTCFRASFRESFDIRNIPCSNHSNIKAYRGRRRNRMTPVLEAEGLTKRFGKVEALAGLDLSVPAGQLVALLGPNGAGKSTFVRMVATLARPDGGSVRVG